MIRSPAVAGSWYPATPTQLHSVVDHQLKLAEATSSLAPDDHVELVGLIAPHAGLVYSGPVAAHAYRLLRTRAFDVIVLVGPSHHVPFEGVSVWPRGAFETPIGELRIAEDLASALMRASPHIEAFPAAHAREHSLEMQLPFLATVAADTPILPLVMGHQSRATAFGLADALVATLSGCRALLVASSDLSHFFDVTTAARLDAVVVEEVDSFSPDGLMSQLEKRPDHACGGGPIVTVMRAARGLGATTSRVLHYADSSAVSGDKTSVVGYLAAAMWR